MARPVPDPKEFNRLTDFVHVVINEIAVAQHFSCARSPFDGLTGKRALTYLNRTIQKLVADSESRFRVGTLHQAFNNLLEIRNEVIT